MKISICIPQYNRIHFLLQALAIIEEQTYSNIEVVVSDDCSSDDTPEEIGRLKSIYKYPIVYHRNSRNLGYDANYRQSVALATGEYCIVIGNDDSIFGKDSIHNLVEFIKENQYPEIGFANFVEAKNTGVTIHRARTTEVLGSGPDVAMNYYSCFSFVGGLIYKKSAFDQYNTSKHDGSIYAQVYLGCLMIASGCRLFSIKEPIVIKDLEVKEEERKSYKDVIARKWKDYKMEQGGLPSVINVLIDAFRDARVLTPAIIFKIFRRIYGVTYPHWILDYKSNGAFPAAMGLVHGLWPGKLDNFRLLSFFNRAKIRIIYFFVSVTALLTPVFVYQAIRTRLYDWMKK
ncbi:MAG: hypothetical protein C5B52_09535 [Bacteroidetes bacterium]|nr:MAG: hypothetical protein C5B52_09535 [Bacteroidota bacterium]